MGISVICKICGDSFIPKDKRQTARCSKQHLLNCHQCGHDFPIKANTKLNAIYCSRECRGLAERKERSCVQCGKEIKGRSRTATTCSDECTRLKRNSTYLKRAKYCEWCGSKFYSASVNARFCEGEHFKNCEVCGVSFIIENNALFSKGRRTCSDLCNGQLVNTHESNAKRRATSLKNWGTEFPQQSDEVKEKIKESHYKKIGYPSPLASPAHRQKGFETSEKRYGHKWPRQHGESKRKAEATNLERYGSVNPFGSEVVKEKIRSTMEEKYGNGLIPHPRISSINKTLAKKLINSGFVVTFEKSFSGGYADLCINDMLLLDLHPTVSHNSEIALYCKIKGCSLPCSDHTPTARDYHFKRAQAAFNEDKTLIQWYGWESEEALVSLLEGKLGKDFRKYSARKLEVRNIIAKEASSFLALYHVQGSVRNQGFCYGLFNGDELLAVATFGKSRFKSKADFEWLRYAVKSDVIIHGGSGLLFKTFCKEINPKSVISYIDFNHTTRKSTFLSSLDFEEGKTTGPALMWHRLSDNKVIKGTSLLAVGADRLLGTSYGLPELCGMNNQDIMLLEGFLPVYTAGNRVFRWDRD